MAKRKITNRSMYWNEIHQKWLFVPPHWINTYADQWTDHISIPTDGFRPSSPPVPDRRDGGRDVQGGGENEI